MSQDINPSPAEPVDLTGRLVSDYQLIRRLGRGGMADVYLATQQSLGRKVALKVLKLELAKDDAYVQRFRQEAQAAANLVQSNIVQIYEVGQAGEFHFIAQEYIQGRNLRQYLDRHGAVEPVMAVNVLRQCAMALQEAESGEFNVIHRDIKPENIMISTKGEVKITDFGLARINNDSAKQALTQIGMTMGTPLYMSPEQIQGTKIDHRSDIYSLGVTAYHMLAGQPPFDGDNPLSIAVQHLKETPPPLSAIRPDVPEELCRLVIRMMAKEPDDRPATASQLLKELRRIKLEVDDWDLIVEKLSANETTKLVAAAPTGSWTEAKLAATRQLQWAMRGNVRSWWRSAKTWLSLAALSVAGLAGGIFAAQSTAPPSLLKVDSEVKFVVPKKATVAEQYDVAKFAIYQEKDEVVEEYFKAVWQYFPASTASEELKQQTLWINLKAKRRLAEFYLMRGKMNKALSIFDEFVDEFAGANTVPEIKTAGYAGRAIVYDSMPADQFPGGREEKLGKIRQLIGQVIENVDQLTELLAKRFDEVRRRYDEESSELSLVPKSTPVHRG